MWLQVGGAVLTGIFAGKSEEKKAKRQFKYDWKLQEGSGAIERKNMRYQLELQRYLERLGKQDKERGLREFKKFSTVSSFAPDYQNTTPPVEVPTLPAPDAGMYAPAGP